MNWKDVFVRAAKTFVEVFLTAFPVSAALGLDVSALEVAALSAGSAAAAIVWNALLEWSRK